MKFLQTGDWHLGKIFHETQLIEDQKAFLDQITGELSDASSEGDPYDALIVTGDIYDRAVPPSEAVTALSTFLTETHSAFPSMHIFMLAGNHDSADRLSFAKGILTRSNIHLCTDTSTLTTPVIAGSGDDAAAVYQIPFLRPGDIQPEDSMCAQPETGRNAQQELFSGQGSDSGNVHMLRSQQELLSEAVRRIADAHTALRPSMPSVVCAHVFASESGAESYTGSIGTVEQADAGLFSPFTYTALGHLHIAHRAAKGNVWYSGSPLPYSFDDASETFMLSVTVRGTDVAVTKKQFHPVHPVVRLTGPFSIFYGDKADRQLIERNADSYVEIICTDSMLPANAMMLLRKNFRGIMSLRKLDVLQEGMPGHLDERRKLIESDGRDKPGKLFDMFIRDMYGTSAPEAEQLFRERELFLKLATEHSWTEG